MSHPMRTQSRKLGNILISVIGKMGQNGLEHADTQRVTRFARLSFWSNKFQKSLTRLSGVASEFCSDSQKRPCGRCCSGVRAWLFLLFVRDSSTAGKSGRAWISVQGVAQIRDESRINRGASYVCTQYISSFQSYRNTRAYLLYIAHPHEQGAQGGQDVRSRQVPRRRPSRQGGAGRTRQVSRTRKAGEA